MYFIYYAILYSFSYLAEEMQLVRNVSSLSADDEESVSTQLQTIANESPELRYDMLRLRLFEHGHVPLHDAAFYGSTDLIQGILDSMTSEQRLEVLRMQNDEGRTVLHRAVMSDSFDVVTRLLELLIDVELVQLMSMVDRGNRTAKDWAIYNNNTAITSLLKDYRPTRRQERIVPAVVRRGKFNYCIVVILRLVQCLESVETQTFNIKSSDIDSS